MDKLLLVDIGGTHIRHAIASSSSNEITEINKDLFSTKKFEKIIQDLIQTNNINILSEEEFQRFSLLRDEELEAHFQHLKIQTEAEEDL